MTALRFPALLLAALTAGCGTECDRGDMLASPEGLLVTADEHPDGWGRTECDECHALEVVHRSSCTEGVDLAAVRARVDDEGLESCAGCHGDNGAAE